MVAMSENRESVVKRLKRIEGQVGGLVRMLEDGRYCIDILHQIQATKAALTKAETELLRAHAGECVDEALRRGTVQEKRKKLHTGYPKLAVNCRNAEESLWSKPLGALTSKASSTFFVR